MGGSVTAATYYSSVATASSSNAGAGFTTGRPDHMVVRDPEVIRVLAHPARLTILEHLAASGGDITATEAAEIVGLSPSATSYHLRALAKVDMIREAPSRGDGRERVYTVAPSRKVDINTEGFPPGTEAAKLADALLDAVLARGDERIRRWREHRYDEPEGWSDASIIHEAFIRVTPQELTEIFEKLTDVLDPYRQSQRAEAPEGSRVVSVQLRGIPVR